MPSLRQPVGPLPASIYWRRRIVVLAALLAVLALILWLTSGQNGSGGKSDKAALPAPVQSITPGATPSGPAITSRPGGGSGGGGTGATGGGSGGEVSLNGGTGAGGGGTSGGGTGSGGSSSGGSGTGGGGTGSGGTGGGSGGSAAAPPATNTAEVMALPVCTASQVTLELAPSQNAYESKDKPKLLLTVRNTSTANCRVDLGRTASTIVVTSTANERIWSSGDCPADRQSTWVQLAADTGLTETFSWDRSRSKPQCATTDGSAAPAGNYLVQASLNGPAGGPATARTSIRLEG
ncbi:hypothetical protein CFP65_3214 [Kitasatospora sp. MMS16-BH015]|uniref:hypothetical protein n=1 Tax=Kitasatospora sp. MMS16-BH015 TaxID=2018025 RepID=UPI000CA1EBC3|nr:hypothetical protein [Kitasatospora sp. MMS16-BH015]AUG78018.1 hypothetical protein CFP65_3214 [Kitasatospora sp. MMS16-BH015]